MRIEKAIEHDDYLEVQVDGKHLRAGEKYTILELGYAVFLLDENDEDWLEANGDIIQADPDNGRNEFRSGNGMLITADPVLVALALESWWARNGFPKAKEVELPIPTAYEAVSIVRNRRILNEFNKKWEGIVPGLQLIINKYSQN